ncbi:MAG: hypothetical protein KIT80_15580 [Chitinophagaceae bacterium]|nr:hypothetical protein [Chitinophagaceae bacterium]MCW5928336.1 hypothetical protein [Chitinophagaceae bacterium]
MVVFMTNHVNKQVNFPVSFRQVRMIFPYLTEKRRNSSGASLKETIITTYPYSSGISVTADTLF